MIGVQSSAYLPYGRKQQLNYVVQKVCADEGPKDITQVNYSLLYMDDISALNKLLCTYRGTTTVVISSVFGKVIYLGMKHLLTWSLFCVHSCRCYANFVLLHPCIHT